MVLAAAGGAGCATSDDATLRILGNIRPDSDCRYSTDVPSDGETYQAGYLDLAFGRTYTAHLLVQNDGEDPIHVNGGWRSIWYEPEHIAMIHGRGDAARSGLVSDSATIEGKGGRAVVGVDLLGDGLRVAKDKFSAYVEDGRDPATLPEEYLVSVTLEGDADGTVIKSNAWEYGLTATLRPLVEFPAGTDSAAVPGRDCCSEGASVRSCTPGQDYQGGSCFACVSCWPEICNFGQNPTCGGFTPPSCPWAVE